MTQPARVSAIDVRGVEKIYAPGTTHSVRALNRVSLDIRDNEFFTLLGPSGCGKTTLLRLIAGFEYATQGEIRLFGDPLEGLPPYRRPVNTVFQHYALFPHMTVAENVAFGLEMLGRDRADIKRTVAETLALVRMSEYAARTPAQLSGGQQQRIAFARALAPSPRVLLLDEPLSALDLKLRQSMRLELKALQAKTGITFLFVTHDQEEALTMSDRVAVMSDGEVKQVGTPVEIYEEPASRFVAEFIGETNLIAAKVVARGMQGDEDTARCAFAGGEFPVVTNRHGKRPGDAVTLALRPEKLRISAPEDSAGSGAMQGRILDRIYLGTDTAYRVSVAGDLVLVVRDQNAETDHLGYSIGETVCLHPAPGAVRMLEG